MKEPMMKTTMITLAAVLAFSNCLAPAQAAHHTKKSRHLAARSVKTPTRHVLPPNGGKAPCPIPGMGTANEVGVDNDFNVYRDRPEC
jgi:hypothetical protein